jgi:D-sorbitol dehydrogenase (acceptor)
MRLAGKVAIVTGAASGMGKAIARTYVNEGASVLIADVNRDGADAVASELNESSAEPRASAFTLDVRDPAQAEAVVAHAVSTFGGLDILVNNAGIIAIQPFLEITEADWDSVFDINCKGVLWCAQAAARRMIEQGRGGKIINIASQAGRRGEGLVLTYCASKAVVISMTQSMALALAEHKINVNGIAPGVVDTPAWVQVDRRFAELMGLPVGEPKRRAVAAIPLGRIEQPEDVAGMAVFLASAESDYITQQTFNVDGGNWPS